MLSKTRKQALGLRKLLDLRLGGAADNVTLMAALCSGMVANPLFSGGAWMKPLAVVAAAAGSTRLAQRAYSALGRRVFSSPVFINSDVPSVNLRRDWGGMLIGYTVDTGKPVVVPWKDWVQHGLVIGRSGMGKTVLGTWLQFQQIMRGGGVFNIDAKVDGDNMTMVTAMCAYAGRRHHLRLINPGDPNLSNTYSPILDGDADEVASRVISLIPSAENNPGADHYRQAANEAVTIFTRAIKATGFAYTFRDLSILLQNEQAMIYLQNLLPANSEAAGMYKIFLERFRTVDKSGKTHIDVNKLLNMFGGVAGRMFSFGEGNFGRLTETYSPEVNLFDDITSNRIIYIALPTMAKQEAALNFAKMTVADWRSALARIQLLPKAGRPWPPTLGFFDEAGGYINQPWGRILEQARSANQAIIPAIQTRANIDAVSKELGEMLMGNMATLMSFALGTPDTIKAMADAIGEENVVQISTSLSSGGGESASAGTGIKQASSRQSGFGYSEKLETVYKVRTTDLAGLEQGEAVVSLNRRRVAHVKVPNVRFSDEFLKRVGTTEVNHARKRVVKGLDLFKKFGGPSQASAGASP